MSAPLVVKDKVIVGQNGGDGAFRGYLTAFYTKAGRMASYPFLANRQRNLERRQLEERRRRSMDDRLL